LVELEKVDQVLVVLTVEKNDDLVVEIIGCDDSMEIWKDEISHDECLDLIFHEICLSRERLNDEVLGHEWEVEIV
jgi:hypothetical protein